MDGNRVINNLRFADDIDIIEQSNEKLKETVDKLVKLHIESERYGMLYVVKTKTMVFGEKKKPKRMMLK